MGRGRQKAKQTKVARKLKYFSPDTDLDALQRELASSHEESEDDLYSKYADVDFDDEDDKEFQDEDFWTPPASR